MKVQCKNISDASILSYLADRQGRGTNYWRSEIDPGKNVREAFPLGTPEKLHRAKLKKLHTRGLIGGCACGCKGNFEITDKGLALLGLPGTAAYVGY